MGKKLCLGPGRAGESPADSFLAASFRQGVASAALYSGRSYRQASGLSQQTLRRSKLFVHRLKVIPAQHLGFEALVLEPLEIKARRPAWVCFHGAMTGGMSSMTGLIERMPSGAKDLEQYEDDYGLQLARRGYVTFNFHLPGFGRRGPTADTGEDWWTGMTHQTLLLGRTYWGWCLTESMAAVSVLRDWPTVQPGRVGVIGFSLGAILAAMAAVIDRRGL